MLVKKSLFSKPAWAAKTAPAAGRDQPIFGQSIYGDILEANRKKEEKRLAKQKEHEEQKAQKSKRQSINTKTEDEQVTKKRRISADPVDLDEDEGEDDNDETRSDSEGSVATSGSEEEGDHSDNSQSREDHGTKDNQSFKSTPPKSKRSAQNLESVSHSQPKYSKESTIVIDDDEDEGIQVTSERVHRNPPPAQVRNSKAKPPPVVESEAESDEEDEYIRELKRKARAEAREKRRHAALSETLKQQDKFGEGNQYSKGPQDCTHDNGLVEEHNTGTPTPVADPRDPSDTRVQILITTIIPNCSSVVVDRFASQPLDKVFSYWKRRNNLDERPLADQVFFIWTGQKLYNSTTTRSILEQIKRRHGTKSDGSDLAEGKIEIEAVIPEIYQHRLQQRERRRAETEDTYLNNTKEVEDSTNETIAALKQQDPGIVIHLKSRDKDVLPFLNLRVRPDTTVQRIINGYKRKVKLDSSRQIYLIFDGERLRNEANVEQIGLEDEDAVDVME